MKKSIYLLLPFLLLQCSTQEEDKSKAQIQGECFKVTEYNRIDETRKNEHHYFIEIQQNKKLGHINKYFPLPTTQEQSLPPNKEDYFHFPIKYKLKNEIQIQQILNPRDFYYSLRETAKTHFNKALVRCSDSLRPLLNQLGAIALDSATLIDFNTKDVLLYNIAKIFLRDTIRTIFHLGNLNITDSLVEFGILEKNKQEYAAFTDILMNIPGAFQEKYSVNDSIYLRVNKTSNKVEYVYKELSFNTPIGRIEKVIKLEAITQKSRLI